jgi:hypothetical protein
MLDAGSFRLGLTRRSAAALGFLLLALIVVFLWALAPHTLVPALLGLGAAGIVAISAIRVDLLILALVATGPLETSIVISSNPQITVTRIVGLLAFAGFVIHLLATRRPLRLEWTHGVVLGLFLLALVSTLQAPDSSLALATTLRYGGFGALYFIVSQLGEDQRQSARGSDQSLKPPSFFEARASRALSSHPNGGLPAVGCPDGLRTVRAVSGSPLCRCRSKL